MLKSLAPVTAHPALLRESMPFVHDLSMQDAMLTLEQKASKEETHRPAYRSDIDGLRAVAVLTVVLFHFGFPMVRGGYVGVDMFFVISGYVITKTIAPEISNGTFSLGQFYARRIRRIFPALLTVLACSSLASLVLKFPSEFIDFSKSLTATILLSSNLFFLSKAQYFSGTSGSMPLLHTWSLAIEEQFYLFYPLLLLAAARLWRGNRFALSLVALLVSATTFCVSAVMVYVYQEGAFYLLISRAWELAIGSILALSLLPVLRHRIQAELVSLTGLLMISLSVIFYHPALHFPGALALFPVLGAAAIIYAGSAGCDASINRILRSRPLAFVGLMSYSIYLWHWPVWVFWLDYSGHQPGMLTKFLLLSLCLLLSYLSWRFVETPMRASTSVASQHPWRFLMIGSSICLALGASALAAKGWPSRFTPSQVVEASYLDYQDSAVYRRGTCFIDSHIQQVSDFDFNTCLTQSAIKPNVLLIGDSHAAHLWKALADTYPNLNFMQATATGCKPVFESRGERPCVQLMDDIISRFIPQSHPDLVILAARWDFADIDNVKKTIAKIAPDSKSVYVFGPIVTYETSLPRLLAQAEVRGPSFVDAARVSDVPLIDSAFAQALHGVPTSYVSLSHIICPSARACITHAKDGSPLQWDYGHLTYQGGLLLVNAMRDQGVFP